MDTTTLIHQAKKALDDRHPTAGFPIKDGSVHATARATVALAVEQQATNRHLASIAESLAVLAAAAQCPTAEPTPEPEPKRRLWLPTRRR